MMHLVRIQSIHYHYISLQKIKRNKSIWPCWLNLKISRTSFYSWVMLGLDKVNIRPPNINCISSLIIWLTSSFLQVLGIYSKIFNYAYNWIRDHSSRCLATC